jgi:multidrug efflux system membrane fusion protein
MIWARISALAVLVLASLWVASGYLRPATPPAPPARVAEQQRPLFKVAVAPVRVVAHARRLTLTGRTQSDQRVMVSARTSGIITRLAVSRGAQVAVGDLIAELSDEAREANVAQARARLAQRAAELEAREALARRGNYPMLSLEEVRAEKRAAEAVLASAEAELLRANITAPIAGMINDLPVEVGQGVVVGAQIAEIIAPDPILAVVELPERRLGGASVGDRAEIRLVTGEIRGGEVRFIARRPSGQTRTYRVDVRFANPDGAIADGIAAEVALVLAPVEAAQVPRSALIFSSDGRLGLRFVDPAGMVGFAPVELIEDDDASIWVRGLKDGQRIIVRGQDFIREGERVEAVEEPLEIQASRR